MDLLTAANEINAELGYMRAQNKQIITEQGRAHIFNSLIVALTEGLLDSVEFSVLDRQTNRELLNWSYDLQDKEYIRRKGPTLQDIITVVAEAPRSAYIDCRPYWSTKFRGLDEEAKANILRGTVWEKAIPTSRVEIFGPTPLQHYETSFDLRELELDLRKLEAETRLLGKRSVNAILESVKVTLLKGYIAGVHLMLVDPKEKRLLLEWGFVVQPGTMVRKGQHIEQIIGIARSLKHGPQLTIKPVLSPQFQEMSPADQQFAMKDTIWADDFSQPSKPSKRRLLWK